MEDLSLVERLMCRHGIYQRSFLKFCTFSSSLTNKRYKIMADDFLKKYYIQILDKAKKDIHDCRVYIHDFKGRYSRLQELERSIKRLGFNTDGYDDDGRDGYVFIDNISINEIKTLHAHYYKSLTIDNTFYGNKTFDEIRLSLKLDRDKIISRCNKELGITS